MYLIVTATITKMTGFFSVVTSIAAVQAEDVRASILFVGDLNGHHQEWLDSTTTNRHGVAALDFSTVWW